MARPLAQLACAEPARATHLVRARARVRIGVRIGARARVGARVRVSVSGSSWGATHRRHEGGHGGAARDERLLAAEVRVRVRVRVRVKG